jgi:hypothetical protein
MNIRGAKMAAEAKRLIDHPAAKWLLGATQALAVAIIMALASSATEKLNSILTAINGFGKDLALLQQQVNLNTSGLSTNKADIDTLKSNVVRLDMRVELLEREGRKGEH